ncbi:glycosyltransferase [Kaarinaea lacus]
MRILMISDVYFPRINGVSTSINTFKNELESLGHQVTLIVPQYTATEKTESTIVRVPARYLPLDPEDRAMRWRKVYKLLETLPYSNYDILHIQTPFIAHYVGVSLARKFNIPRVETYHTYFEEYLYHYIPFLPKAWMKYIARHYTKTQCNDLDAVIVPSTAMQKVLLHYGVKTFTEVLPTGIELEKFRGGDGIRFKKKFGIPLDRPILIFIGRVAFEKNIDFLLRVIDKVRHSIPNVLLLIAGEGPSLAHLKKLTDKLRLKDNVLFLGYLDRSTELLDCYACGDAFVFASNTETQGLVLLEAMALGIPLVSTAVMGTKDILAPNKGALVCNESIDEFTTGVITLLKDNQLREKLSLEALEYAKTWSAPIMANKLIRFYEHVIHNITHR